MDGMTVVFWNYHTDMMMAFQNIDSTIKQVAFESLSSSICTLFADLSSTNTGTV